MRHIATQKEVREFAKELGALVKEEGILRVEVKVVPVKKITDRQREVLVDLLHKLGYDPESSALPESARDASRLIAYFLNKRKSYSKKRRRTSTKRS